mgnify:CR=1 FL=1
MASKEKKKKTRQHGPIRDNLEAIGVAIVAAVLLKLAKCVEDERLAALAE